MTTTGVVADGVGAGLVTGGGITGVGGPIGVGGWRWPPRPNAAAVNTISIQRLMVNSFHTRRVGQLSHKIGVRGRYRVAGLSPG